MKLEVTAYQAKRLIADTLKTLMLTKPFSKITVSEIVSVSKIDRTTFYYHFGDIYALLKWLLDAEAVEVVKHFDLLNDYEAAIRFAMQYIEENSYIINCAYDSIGRDEMKRFFCADFTGIISSVIDSAEASVDKSIAPDFKEYAAKFYTEAIAGMLID